MYFKTLLFVVLLGTLAFAPVGAQTVDEPDVLSRAAAYSTAGRYADVITLLEPYVHRHPTRVEAWLLLAQHHYWSGDPIRARRTFETALQRFPDRRDVRLAYARFLLETGAPRRARDLLRPLGPEQAEAEALRGTIAWWAGDLTAAARYFKSALATNPLHAEAASSLATIRAGARPWVHLAGQGGTDNQPLSQHGGSVEAGLFITPLHVFLAVLDRTHYTAADSVLPVTSASVHYRSFWPAVRLELKIAAGTVHRLDSTYATGSLDGRFRLPHGVRLGARWEQAPYLYTLASLSESVMGSAVQAGVSIDRAGWLGEAGIQRERFPDDNTKEGVYGWLMAPLFRTENLTLQAGYAFNYQDAEEHRFTPVLTSAPSPGDPPVWEGRYVPYYTPVNLHVHSLTGSMTLEPGRMITFRAGGSYGVAGSEEAPFIYLLGRAPTTGLYQRSIHPWDVRGSITAAIRPSITLHLAGTHTATAWYDASTLQVSLYVRFSSTGR